MSEPLNDGSYPVLDSGTVKELDKKIANIGKPSIFIASSRESKAIAEKIKHSFPEDKFQVDIWYDGVFGKTRSSGGEMANMEWLKNFTDIYDFAVFIFVPDDKIVSETRFDMKDGAPRQALATRHNVVFEFGMFLGRIGVKRSFILFDEHVKDFVDLFFTDLKENLDDRKTEIEINREFKIELYSYKGNYKNHLENEKMKTEQESNEEVKPYDKESIENAIKEMQVHMIENFNEIEIGFLPATTLAFGYFNNFISSFVKGVNILKTNDSYPVDGGWKNVPVDKLDRLRRIVQSAAKIKFKVVIPTSIEGSQQKEFIPHFHKRNFLEELFPGESRGITIYAKKEVNESDKPAEWIIYDVPTTINSTIEAIDLLTTHKDIRELLKEKELRNFKKSMEHKIALARKVDLTRNIDDYIEFITFDKFKEETQ